MEQLSKEQAIALYESKFWENMSYEGIATFQSFQDRLCIPFEVYHKAMEETLGRSVYTHEFAGREGQERLQKELTGETKSPSFQDIINLIPKNKATIIVTTP